MNTNQFGCHEEEVMIYYNVNGWTRACYKLTSSPLTTPKNIIACTELHYIHTLHFINKNYISCTLPKFLHYHSLWPSYMMKPTNK